MFGIGPMEFVLILVVALLVLGPKRMPELARTLGRGLAEFRRASNDLRQSLALDDLQNELRDGLAGKSARRGPKGSEDRPAQAGDDLEPGPLATGPADAKSDEGSGERSDEASAAKPGEAGAAGPEAGEDRAETSKAHPGELPLDDEHAHAHRQDGDPTPEERDAGTRPRAAEPAPDAGVARSTSAPVDPPLGNVPVGGGGPAPTTRPRTPSKPAGRDPEPGSDHERG